MGTMAGLGESALSFSLLLSSLVLIVALGAAAFFLDYIRRIGCSHSIQKTAASDSFFEDPSSLAKVPCPSIFDPAEYISLIIPAYNEEDRLPSTLDETLNYLQLRSAAEKSFSYEVLIVDDGSRDHTSRVAFDYVKKYKIDNVRVLLLGKNHGKGEAIRKGMLHSRGELLLMLDADGATKLTDLEKLESQVYKHLRRVRGKLTHLLIVVRDCQTLKLQCLARVLIWRSRLLQRGSGTGTF
ncbi:Dolichyl-phosphate beta-glucosyltransferase [Rhynchospora pubera]|uniref:Dolichyl-phosphate beta-glucosyltransferase n=1 Tax=Rhynchospora pubera TaxID=906938 RepID=A0AAV8HP39_9POAL|nr:Dolichyl-phosphate beta-glucosyltransferase [Rhynchospora pubera]